ncbi:MAG: ATP-dependent helicase [Sedimentisphaerales bacterium]|nr:ATP-dependent helicase [Sedimentisphaerales bacterium]
MPITAAQKAQAEQRQWAAARDGAPQVRLVAGPGTGKSHTIEKRVADLLTNGAIPGNIYVISFTRATCAELTERIRAFCRTLPCANTSMQVRVSTMHSLALRILRRANLLTSYPSTPIMLDDWEKTNVYDKEFAGGLGCTPSRATEIRLAHDAQWQTLNPQYVNQAQITLAEIQCFNAFHSARTNLYCCVLPGEVIFKCVDALQQEALQANQLPQIDHLIVDEFQDLNACDQEFVRLLSAHNTVLFVAGDDDQSIYSFRHANPDGIVQFQTNYPASATHVLTDCFRCTPAVLEPASRLITYNVNRFAKNVTSLYGAATPPVQGRMMVWSFQTAQEEAHAVAQSCQELINAGMAGREDEIIILISNRRVQLDMLAQELGNLGLPYDPPRGAALTNEYEAIRAVYSVLRIARDNSSSEEDYPAHRDLLEVLSGVGGATAKGIADTCISNNQNFRQLFYLPTCPPWFSGRCPSAVQRVMATVQAVRTWSMSDTLAARSSDISVLLSSQVFTSGRNTANNLSIWNNLVGALPVQMTLEELLQFLAADNESDQQAILNLVNQRIGGAQPQTQPPVQKRIRILTMHGAKGLSGKVVFIPSAEQGLMPNFRALQATGLLIEQRRLFYVSVTRAMACCIASHAAQHSGAQAMALTQKSVARLTRSQFLNEMSAQSVTRTTGLSQNEAAAIVAEINRL